MADNVLRFDYLARDRGASQTTDRIAGKMDNLSGKMVKFGKVAGFALAAAGVAVVTGAPKILAYAGKLEQMGEKAQTVFGGQLGVVQKWASSNSAAMGLTSRGALGLAANFGDLLIPMGFTRKEAAGMSTDVVGLSGALSRWSGGTKSAEEVSKSLAKAMLGEREELKGLGISITDADVKARLLSKGQDKLTGSALAQAKAVATQELIFEKSVDAQKAYAAGSDTVLAKVDKLKAKFKGYGESLITTVTPALKGILNFTADTLLPGLEGIGATLSNIDLSGVGSGFAKQAKTWALSIIGGVKTGLDTGDWSSLGLSLGRGITSAIGKVASFAGKIAGKFADVLGKIDWVSIGVSVGRQAPSLLVGIAVGILDFDLMGLLKGLAHNWRTVLFAILTVAFLPAKIIGGIARVLGKIPLVGPLLKWGFEHFAAFSKGIVGAVWRALRFMGRAFLTGFRRVFPGVGESFAKSLSLLPIRLGLVALEVRAKALTMMRRLAGAIGSGIGRVVSNIGELIARMLRPFARAGGWLIGKGRQFVSGLREGIADRARDLGSFLKTRIVDRITNRFSGAPRWLILSGRRLLAGLYDGMLQKVRDAGRWASNLGGSIVRAVKRYFGISSPSTVFAGLGRHLTAGLFKGMIESYPVRSIGRIFGGMPEALGALVNKGMISVRNLPGRAMRALSGLGGKFAGLFAKLGGGAGVARMMGILRGRFPGLGLISGYRPGAITATGNRSYHAMGRAVDIAPSMAIFNWIRSLFRGITKELIFSPAGGRQIHNGANHMYSGITRAMHWNHVHWAMAKGGVIREPVLGVGQRSGSTYSLGESGPETVTPGIGRAMAAGGGGGDLHVHIHGNVVATPRELAVLMTEAVETAKRTGWRPPAWAA